MLIHSDLDVSDPNELKFAVGTDPDGMTLQAVSRVINGFAKTADIVGLTVAEPMPREVLKLKSLLDNLPMFFKCIGYLINTNTDRPSEN